MQVSLDFRSIEQAGVVIEALTNSARNYRGMAGLTQTTEEERKDLERKAYLIEDCLENAVKP